MVKKQKLWAHYEKEKNIIGTFIALIFVVPSLIFCFNALSFMPEINDNFNAVIKPLMLSSLKWYAVIMPIITVLFIVWAIYFSDRVEFTDTELLYYRWIFSKNPKRRINYTQISDIVFNDGLWYHSNKYEHGRKIQFFNKNQVLIVLGLYYRICLKLILMLGDTKVRLVNDDCHLSTVDKYFKISFMSLSYKQQLQILKYYCKTTRTKYKTGEEILRKHK